MKINPIVSIVKSRKNIQIREDAHGFQWIGDGGAFYPLYGFPKLNEETIFRFIDVPKDKQSKFTYSEGEFPEGFPTQDAMPGEKLLKIGKIRIQVAGVHLLPIYTDNGVIFINERYLVPYRDEENGYELYERNSNGQYLIAVKTGFLLAGLIAPMKIGEDAETELCTICSQLAAKPYSEEEDEIDA